MRCIYINRKVLLARLALAALDCPPLLPVDTLLLLLLVIIKTGRRVHVHLVALLLHWQCTRRSAATGHGTHARPLCHLLLLLLGHHRDRGIHVHGHRVGNRLGRQLLALGRLVEHARRLELLERAGKALVVDAAQALLGRIVVAEHHRGLAHHRLRDRRRVLALAGNAPLEGTKALHLVVARVVGCVDSSGHCIIFYLRLRGWTLVEKTRQR
ncbi:hypothetical protein BC828DRAFT_383451 [Blastocladiella britannica]|nr:hypothetical protein BC828DRAFT_383451 [Blastocladiella britannica]